tara:strand:+ start:338 stop:688 length:351 start_codon:yes stop_codon:yes gene_type:complete
MNIMDLKKWKEKKYHDIFRRLNKSDIEDNDICINDFIKFYIKLFKVDSDNKIFVTERIMRYILKSEDIAKLILTEQNCQVYTHGEIFISLRIEYPVTTVRGDRALLNKYIKRKPVH